MVPCGPRKLGEAAGKVCPAVTVVRPVLLLAPLVKRKNLKRGFYLGYCLEIGFLEDKDCCTWIILFETTETT